MTANSATLAPLDDPAYVPQHPPVNGFIPDVVAKWGVRSQQRWFRRFRNQVAAQPYSRWALFYCDSAEHLGLCCPSCIGDQEEGYYDMWEHCCCRGIKLEGAGA